MLKIKFFFTDLQDSVQNWLYQNQNIEIISTNLTCDKLYSILYKEMSVGNDADEVD